ncbi:MAG: flagellar motor switch phosphatase FliY [Lachnospiraceae bacterium]|nr:flagellar motor switch phosphatase FliY [Lachnospiraceae bacterium]
MDGMLSQDEINALLSGMDLSGSTESEAVQETTPVSSEIDENLLTDTEKDAVGEVANISMGSSATTLYSLVNRKVNITTPVVTMANWQTVLEQYEKPCVFVQIKYTQGLDGSNILVLKEDDVKIIADLMMGGDGANIDGELGELHLSAISEAMNQMMGSSATSLSTMLGIMIDISPPEASRVDLTTYHNGSDISPFLGGTFVKIAFRMQIGDLIDSTIMQLYPVDFAKTIVETFITQQMGGTSESPAPETPAPAPAPAPQPATPAPDMGGMNMQQPMMGMSPQPMMDQQAMMGMNPMMMGMGMPMQAGMGMPPQMAMNGMAQMYMPPQVNMQQGVNVQPAQFQNFAGDLAAMTGQENIGLIKDVPLEVTVELGRTTKSIADILDFAPGTIIELDRIAGEPIDVLVNGKFVARGEVVVIEESFGIRVTEIIK